MKVLKLQQNSEEWLEFRKGKIGGSKVNDIVPRRDTGKKKDGFYKLVADKVSIDRDGEDVMARGHRLEPEAIEHFQNITGKQVDTGDVVWVSDDNPEMYVSPDGSIKDTQGDYIEAVEVKCLDSHKHIRAYDENTYPDEYREQVYQYFIVNEKLKKLYFVMYTDRIPSLPMVMFEIDKADIAGNLQFYIDYEKKVLKEVDALVEKIAF